jgi:hypothetical protein
MAETVIRQPLLNKTFPSLRNPAKSGVWRRFMPYYSVGF